MDDKKGSVYEGFKKIKDISDGIRMERDHEADRKKRKAGKGFYVTYWFGRSPGKGISISIRGQGGWDKLLTKSSLLHKVAKEVSEHFNEIYDDNTSIESVKWAMIAVLTQKDELKRHNRKMAKKADDYAKASLRRMKHVRGDSVKKHDRGDK